MRFTPGSQQTTTIGIPARGAVVPEDAAQLAALSRCRQHSAVSPSNQAPKWMEMTGRMRKGVCTVVGGAAGALPTRAAATPACTWRWCGYDPRSPPSLPGHPQMAQWSFYHSKLSTKHFFPQRSPITFQHTYLILVSKRFSLSLRLFSLKNKEVLEHQTE